MSHELFGEIRSTLQTPYQRGAWGRLLSILERCKDQDALRTQIIPYAQAHMKRWPQGDMHLRWALSDWYELTPDGQLLVKHQGFMLADAVKFKPSTLTQPWHTRWLADPQHHHLRALTLHQQNISPELLSPIFTNTALLELDLGWNLLGRLSLSMLLSSLPQTAISTLRLGYAGLEDDAIMTIAQAQEIRQLRHLSLRNNELGLVGVIALTQSPHLDQLTTLDLTQLRLKDTFGVLVEQDAFPSLKTLNLAGNDIDLYGAEALAKSPLLSRLESLDLSYNQLNDEGLEVLLSAPDLSSLHTLDLSHNGITEAGVRALARCPKLVALRALTLGPALPSSSIIELGSSPCLPEELKRSFLAISSQGAL